MKVNKTFKKVNLINCNSKKKSLQIMHAQHYLTEYDTGFLNVEFDRNFDGNMHVNGLVVEVLGLPGPKNICAILR